jgi:basic amino acid/polyamine antiporter, APA family
MFKTPPESTHESTSETTRPTPSTTLPNASDAAAKGSVPAGPGTLPRRMGLVTATSVVVASMVGAGILTTTGFMLARVETPAAVLLCWALAGLVALCGALSYAELATMMPQSGGEYCYLRDIYGPGFAFLTGWISFFVGFSAPIAASAVAAAAYFSSAGLLPSTPLASKICGVVIVLALTAIHYRGGRTGTTTQNLLTAVKLALLVLFCVAGFASSRGGWTALSQAPPLSVTHWSGMGLALLFASFAYSGWNASSYIAEEVENPARNLPRSLVLGTVMVIALYLAINLLLFYAVPTDALSGVVAVGAVAAQHLFGPVAATAVSGLLGLALLSSLSAYVLSGPRVYYAMARDGLFFPFARRVHPRFETPSLAIVAQGVCAAVMAVTGTFEQLLTYIAFALGIFPWFAVLGVLLLRRREPQRERPYRVWGYPLVPVFYLSASACMMGVGFASRPGPSLAAIATVLIGIPVYWATMRGKASAQPGKGSA